jgi:hypothetical protein
LVNRRPEPTLTTVCLSGKTTYVAGRIDGRFYPVGSVERLTRRIVGSHKIGTIGGHVNHDILQRPGVLSNWWRIIRLIGAVTHQSGRTTVGKPSIGVNLERIPIPTLRAHDSNATPTPRGPSDVDTAGSPVTFTPDGGYTSAGNCGGALFHGNKPTELLDWLAENVQETTLEGDQVHRVVRPVCDAHNHT